MLKLTSNHKIMTAEDIEEEKFTMQEISFNLQDLQNKLVSKIFFQKTKFISNWNKLRLNKYLSDADESSGQLTSPSAARSSKEDELDENGRRTRVYD